MMNELTNAQLKYLIELYWQTKEELDKLQGDYERKKIYVDMLNKLEDLCLIEQNKTIQSEGTNGCEYWQVIINGFSNKDDASKPMNELKNAEKIVKSSENKRAIVLAEKKLEAIKQILGEDIVKKIEEYEKEKILKKHYEHKE